MGVKTILPGLYSFNTHLIKQLNVFLKNTGSARVFDIVNMLARRDSGYRYTPVHRDALLAVIEDTAMQDLGFVPWLNRRLQAHFFTTLIVTMRIDHDAKSVSISSSNFQSLEKEELEGLGPVFIEYKYYEVPKNQDHNMKQLKRQIMVLVNFLQ